ncbi:integrin alpha-3b isoform X2 [Triplophysa dalaica]|uniref:integrin alpha-3b isoform X2 n=1 Tax=Triplophysa dalaica TaxID=1582913 RepID=UPI0024DFCB2E|nr:integrin alpha-3b isoform X2 [Triplophysa dalaica]
MAGETLRLCAFVMCAIHASSGFNIDTQFPIIKEGKNKGSFFGFSVALHKQTGKIEQHLLLVGAPQEKAQASLSKFNINQTGAVYSCPITTARDDCRTMDLITPPQSTEMVEGMWLGVTVASQKNGGRVLACGHRYVKILLGAEEQQRMVGKCYVRGNDLSYDPSDYWQSDTYELCDFNYDQNLEGMCNMGISGGMTESDVYFGAPGSFVWQGNVHMKCRDTNSDFEGDADEKSFGKLAEDRLNIYIGYSVLEDIKLLHRSEYTVVTGAPRDGFRGSVIMAQKTDRDLTLHPLNISGEQIGSYFGSSLAVTDLNNDDWNDLIVGAPFYFERYNEEGGAVYIYMNDNGSFKEKASVVLKGKKGSGFGFAVAAVGDVNQDGFQDFAVGAPFQDSGKVYIWMGGKSGITKEPSQVIEGKSLLTGGFQTFGYSLNGGMDVDGNDYPDIVVGSLDDHVALLRARPVIHLSKIFTVEPKIVIPSQCVVNSCIKVKVCFSYILSNGNKAFKKDIAVRYTVDADHNRRGARVRFLDNKLSTFTGLLSFSAPTCKELELSVITPVLDKLQPIVFTLNVSLDEQKTTAQQTLQNLDAFPVLSGQQTLTDKTEINFHKECGADNRCSSNLQLQAKFADENFVPFPGQMMEFNSNIKKLVMLVEVTNVADSNREAEDAHQATLNITIPHTLKYSGLRTPFGFDVQCTADKAVLCDLGNPFKSAQKASLIFIFETSGITLYTEFIDSQLQLSTFSEQKDLLPFPVTLKVKNTILSSFSLERPMVDTSFSGNVVGESAMRSIGDVGSPVEFVFHVRVLGEPLGDMGTLMIDFEWPFEVTNGKWLLYLTEIVVKGTSESRCVPSGNIVNPRNLTLSDEGAKRLKRDVDTSFPYAEAAITVLTPRKVTHLLECSKRTARCVTFSCPLKNMSNHAEIKVRSRVWNSTMLEDYGNALRVQVRGQATLRLLTDKPAIKMDSQTREFQVNIDPVLGEEAPYEVPLWIIIVAAIAGIVLLGIISLILWKCGFFRRASRREMYEAKSQKAEMKIQPSETERLTEEY